MADTAPLRWYGDWFQPVRAERTDPPPRKTEPLLMCDILNARMGEPEFLIRWRQEQDRDGG